MRMSGVMASVSMGALLLAAQPAHAQFGLGKTKLPDAPVISRFEDAAYPTVDPNIPTLAPASLVPSQQPLPVQWSAASLTLSGMLDRIIAAGPRPEVKARLQIYDHVVPNAQSFGDGTILVSTGLVEELYRQAETDEAGADAMFAFTLGHEYGHILMRHPQERAKTQSSFADIKNTLSVAGTVYLIGKTASISQKDSYASQQRQAAQATGVLVGAAVAGGFLESEAKRAFFPGFAKSTERDSDMFSVDLMQRYSATLATPLDPVTGVQALEPMREKTKTILSKTATLLADAGKTTKDTAASFAMLAPGLMLQKGTTDVGDELKMFAIASATNFGLQKLDERQRLSDIHLHDGVDKRIDLVKRYTKEFYRPTAAPTADYVSQVDWTLAEGEMKGSKARQAALAALARGDVAAARTAIDEALASPIGKSAEVQKTAGGVASAENNTDLAIKHFRATLDAGYRDASVYQALIEAYRRKPDAPAAVLAIDEAQGALGDSGAFMPTKITILREAEKPADMATALAACEAITSRPDLVTACRTAANPEASPAQAAAPAPQPAQQTVEAGIQDGAKKVGNALKSLFGQ